MQNGKQAHLLGGQARYNISPLFHNCSSSLDGVAHRQHSKMLTYLMPQSHKPQRNRSFHLTECTFHQMIF